MHLDSGVLLQSMAVGGLSFRRPFLPAGRIPGDKARFYAVFVKCGRLIWLADIHAEQAPDPRGNDIGRLLRQLFCCRLLFDASDYDRKQDEH
jgi:hypothetical protein